MLPVTQTWTFADVSADQIELVNVATCRCSLICYLIIRTQWIKGSNLVGRIGRVHGPKNAETLHYKSFQIGSLVLRNYN